MATAAARDRAFQNLENWAALARQARDLDPSAVDAVFAPFYPSLEAFINGARNTLSGRASIFSDSELAGFVQTFLGSKSNLINRAVGTSITYNTATGQFQSGPQAGKAALPLAPASQPAAPTPVQEAAFGSGVITPEEAAAEIVAQVAAQSPPPPPVIEAVPETSPAPANPPAPETVPTSIVAPVVSAAPVADMTFAEVADVESGPAPAAKISFPVNQVRVMPNGQDPFISTYSTGLPQGGGPNLAFSGGFDLPGAIEGGVETALGGGSLADILKGALGGLLGSGDTTGTPGIAGPAGGFVAPPQNGDKDIEDKLIDILSRFPAFSGPGAIGRVAGGVKSMLSTNGITTQFPGNIVTAPQIGTRLKAPPGYVIVTLPETGEKVAMWKAVARSLGLWKSRPKPPIKASEWKALRTANRVEKKAKKIAQTAGFSCRAR